MSVYLKLTLIACFGTLLAGCAVQKTEPQPSASWPNLRRLKNVRTTAYSKGESGGKHNAIDARLSNDDLENMRLRFDRLHAIMPSGQEVLFPQDAELPAIDGLDATAVDLTRREAQLVDLARQGLSNGEIADRLVLSVRTVETHLYRGMQKLGIKDRRDL